MLDYLIGLFNAAQFVPHAVCLLWRPDLLVMHGVSDLLIALAYLTIPLVILRAVRARPDLLDPKVARLFAAFITACALSHIAGLMTLWVPAYAFQGVIKVLTAAISIYTAVQLMRLLPVFMTLPSREDLARSQAEVLAQTMATAEARENQQRLERAREELLRSNRELDEFAYIASHDLKEPLRGLTINANFLLREDLPENLRKRVERMSLLSQRMEQLTGDLLEYSRLGRSDTAREEISPRELVDAIRTELLEPEEAPKAEVVVETPLPRLNAAKGKAHTVFQNLIANAMKYNDADVREVRVGFLAEAMVNGRRMRDVFYVSDNGIGIQPRHRDKVFRIFSRLNQEEAYGPGTGAGLSFVKKIVEDYGGEIDFVSAPGAGTTFYFSLPLADAVTDPVQARSAAKGAAAGFSKPEPA